LSSIRDDGARSSVAHPPDRKDARRIADELCRSIGVAAGLKPIYPAAARQNSARTDDVTSGETLTARTA
jgi:hypothetical protein